MARHDKRLDHEMREVKIETGVIKHHAGSVMISYGDTKVLACATWEPRVPPHRINSGGGWLTAEYGMLPGSTEQRKARTGSKGQIDGRSIEIQRLIGRSLRQAINIELIGPRTITVDCDVIQADGGTRTASITGGWLALALCVKDLLTKEDLKKATFETIITRQVAAVSLGIYRNRVLTDLSYVEDSKAQTDCNLVACDDGSLIEFQCSAERKPLNRTQMDTMVEQGMAAVSQLCILQRSVLQP